MIHIRNSDHGRSKEETETGDARALYRAGAFTRIEMAGRNPFRLSHHLADKPVIGPEPSVEELCAHLRRLSPKAQTSRFQGAVSEASLESAALRARKAVLTGLWAKDRLVGVCELHPIGQRVSELAISVEGQFCGRGFGKLLMGATLVRARKLRVKRVCMLCSARNIPMRRLYAHWRAHEMREKGDIAAWIDLPG